jgi:hypothetical protein
MMPIIGQFESGNGFAIALRALKAMPGRDRPAWQEVPREP